MLSIHLPPFPSSHNPSGSHCPTMARIPVPLVVLLLPLLCPAAPATGHSASASAAATTAPGLQVKLSPSGAFSLGTTSSRSTATAVTEWFLSSDYGVTLNGKTASTADGSLTPVAGGWHSQSGQDALGPYTAFSLAWQVTAGLAGDPSRPTGGPAASPFLTRVRVYASGNVAIFDQVYPLGANGTASASKNAETSSCFPSLNTSAVPSPMGFLSFQGRFLERSHAGAWSTTGSPGVGTGGPGGPFAVFTHDLSASLVFSAASNFMEATTGTGPDGNSQALCFGLDKPITSVPPGYTLSTVVYLNGSGVNAAVRGWGQALLKLYGTVRSDDYTRSWLGYSTDNGAYYYYNTGRYANGTSMNYEDTLLHIHAEAAQTSIPFQYVLLDSWWYTKGAGGGVKEWEPTASTLPHGLTWLNEQTSWKFQLHNRHWSRDNVYATENGGAYIFDIGTQLAIPTRQHFWDDLIGNKSDVILVYEQDWMYNEWQGLNVTQQSPSLSREWLIEMGAGSQKHNATVQYCMTYARMVLQSVEIPAVTTFRASDDYHPGQTGFYPTPADPSAASGCRFPYCVYYVGTTSIIAWALDLGPSKDNYWSSEVQPGNPYDRGHPNSTREPYSEMQATILSYSCGPVASSDGLGFANATLIKRTCMSNGRLLQPSAPMRALDINFAVAAFGASGPLAKTENNYPLMATFTDIDVTGGSAGRQRYTHVLAIGLAAPFNVTAQHLGFNLDAASTKMLAWVRSGPTGGVSVMPFTAASKLDLPATNYSNFQLWHIAPALPNGVFVIGEVEKIVPISEARIRRIDANATHTSVLTAGAEGEAVTLSFASGTAVQAVTCQVGASGEVLVMYTGPERKGSCS